MIGNPLLPVLICLHSMNDNLSLRRLYSGEVIVFLFLLLLLFILFLYTLLPCLQA